MLHFRHISQVGIAVVSLSLLLPACADEHFFPKVRPLFPGLNEAMVPVKEKTKLAKAKVDFARARHGKAPQYAHLANSDSGAAVYSGEGYRITLVHNDVVLYQDVGAGIVIEPCLTGGAPYAYDEIERLQD